MISSNPRRHNGPPRPGPTTLAFAFILVVVGEISHHLGTESGLLALVLALVALIAAPYVYTSVTSSATDPASGNTSTGTDDDTPRPTNVKNTDPAPTTAADPDEDRSST